MLVAHSRPDFERAGTSARLAALWSVGQLEESLAAVDLERTAAHRARLEEARWVCWVLLRLGDTAGE